MKSFIHLLCIPPFLAVLHCGSSGEKQAKEIDAEIRKGNYEEAILLLDRVEGDQWTETHDELQAQTAMKNYIQSISPLSELENKAVDKLLQQGIIEGDHTTVVQGNQLMNKGRAELRNWTRKIKEIAKQFQ